MDTRCKACGDMVLAARGPTCRRCRALLPHAARATHVLLPPSITFFESGARLLPEAAGYRTAAARPTEGELVIVRRWFRVGDYFGIMAGALTLFVFCSPLLALVLFAIYAIVQASPLALVPIAAVLGYAFAVPLVNRTSISVQAGTLSVRHGPLPFPGPESLSLSTDRIAQIVSYDVAEGREIPRYDVVVRLADGKTVRLLRSLPEPEQALFVEEMLESRLRLNP